MGGFHGGRVRGFTRAHFGSAPPAQSVLNLSSDPAFRGDPAKLNPEQLLVLAASSCQMLSFLALAARARIDVRRYHDRGEAEMPEGELPVRIARITLRPRIVLAAGPSEDSRPASGRPGSPGMFHCEQSANGDPTRANNHRRRLLKRTRGVRESR